MTQSDPRLRVLYSFPHKLGAGRICHTAWQQVNGLAAAGADVTVFPASISQPVAPGVTVRPTLARGRLRIPYRLLGSNRAFALHDHIVARRLKKLKGRIDIVHTWPLGAMETLKVAADLGIPTVLERPNAHTGFAMEVVRAECDRLGVALPPDHEHAYNATKLNKEIAEYNRATCLLCPSDFVFSTFLDKGFSKEHLVRHIYGYDEKLYFAHNHQKTESRGLTVLFVGVCAVRKGLHYALEAWLKSPASNDGTFLIAGEFLPAYKEKLAGMLSHPSIKVLGHRRDIPELMRQSDVLVLPTIEEGSALVSSEAKASGCVLLVSEAAGANCRHMQDALVHCVGDVETLTQHITLMRNDKTLLERLRSASLTAAPGITWTVAGRKLIDAYRETIKRSNEFKIAVATC